jgi:predicted nucleotidyltransferase
MAQIPDKISSIIERFLEELKKNNINIEQAVLFGSYAQGTFTTWSDIDIALVSSDFEGDRFKDRDKIRRIKLKISSDLEPIPYPPNEFTPDDPFVKQILKTGINVMRNVPRKTSRGSSRDNILISVLA